MKHSILGTFRKAVCAALALLVALAFPTGWLYDLWAGTGTEQGQRPNEQVQQLQTQEDVLAFFDAQTPATVTGKQLTACPLARLRDVEAAGQHIYGNRGARRSVFLYEYISTDYPIPIWQRLLQGALSGGAYSRYYLTQLEDRSWLCIYFDDYLALTGMNTGPTGYVRHTTPAERRMLERMANDYDVDSAYVLDMYQHGKVNWTLDLGLRLVVVLAVCVGVVAVREHWKRQRESVESSE